MIFIMAFAYIFLVSDTTLVSYGDLKLKSEE